MRDSGAIAISKALQNNAVLQSLWMYGNKITDVGAKAFGETLKINHTLAKLEYVCICSNNAALIVFW